MGLLVLKPGKPQANKNGWLPIAEHQWGSLACPISWIYKWKFGIWNLLVWFKKKDALLSVYNRLIHIFSVLLKRFHVLNLRKELKISYSCVLSMGDNTLLLQSIFEICKSIWIATVIGGAPLDLVEWSHEMKFSQF